MPSLIKRKSGIYYVVSTRHGKRVWTSLGVRNEEDARQLFGEFEREHRKSQCRRLSLLFEKLTQIVALNYRPKTMEIRASAFKNFLRICGDKMLINVFSLDVEHFKQVRSKEVSAVTVNIELRSLRATFNEAKRLRLVVENPLEGVRDVRVPYKEAPFLTETEFGILLAVIDDEEAKNIVQFAVYTMMRLGEICNLKFRNVDLARRQIHVRSDEEFRVKGGKPRDVPMNDWVFDFLRKREIRGEYVFLNRKGRPIVGNSLSGKFKSYVRKAKLDDRIHFHSLRHTGISWLINKGVPPQFVQRIAGHSSLLVTQTYTHVEDKNLIDAINAFGRISRN